MLDDFGSRQWLCFYNQAAEMARTNPHDRGVEYLQKKQPNNVRLSTEKQGQMHGLDAQVKLKKQSSGGRLTREHCWV